MGFDIYNCFLKIQESIGTVIPKIGAPFGSVKVHSFTLSYIPGSMKCDSWASLLSRTFVNLSLSHKPKARVATLSPTKRISQYPH
jgi:hypothetical protein